MPSTARQFVPGGRRGTRGKHQQWAEEHLQSRESESNIGQTRKLEKWQNGSICRTCTCRAAEDIFRIMWMWWHEYLFSFFLKKKKIPALGHWDCSCWALHGHPAVQSRVVVLAHSCAAVWWWLCSHSCELVSVASLHMSQIRLSPALLIAASTTTLSLICSSFKSLFSALIPWKWVCVLLALFWEIATTPEAAAPPLGTQFPCYAPEKYSMYTRTPLILKRCPEERESKQWLLPSDTETWAFLLDFLRRHPPVVMWWPHRADKGCTIKLSVCWAQPWLRRVHRCHTPMPSVPGRGSHSWVTCPRVTKGLTLCLHHSSASLSFGASRIHCLDSRQIRYGKGIIWKYNYIKGKEKKKTQQQQEKNHNSPWARQAESGWPSAQETWPLGAAQGHKAVQVHTASSQSHWFCDGDVWPAAPAQRLGWAVCVWLHLYHREWDRKTQLAQPLSTDAFSSVGPWFSSWHPPRQQLPPAFPSSKERFAWRIRSSNFSRQKRSGKQVFPLKGEKVLCS